MYCIQRGKPVQKYLQEYFPKFKIITTSFVFQTAQQIVGVPPARLASLADSDKPQYNKILSGIISAKFNMKFKCQMSSWEVNSNPNLNHDLHHDLALLMIILQGGTRLEFLVIDVERDPETN